MENKDRWNNVKDKIGWVELLQLIIFIIAFLLSNYILIDLLKQKFTLTNIQIFAINIAVALFFAGLSVIIKKHISFIREMERKINNSASIFESQADIIARSNLLSETYKNISAIGFSPELIGFMNKINSNNKNDFDGRVIQLAEKISSKYLEKNKIHELWYIIYYQYLIDEFKTTSIGKMNIHLNSYLNIYLEFMNYYLEKCERDGSKFHLVSFTNAIPTDWFKESKITGGNVIDFSVDKIKRIKKMKDKGHTLQMYVLSGGGDDLEAIGIKSKSAVRKDWLKLSNGERNKYLKDLHTSSENALLLNLKIDNLVFEDNLTEYIYFGTSQGVEDIQWEWCISGSYSRFTNNMLANFEFLLNGNENVIVDVANIEKLNFKGEFKPPSRLKITYKDFPKYVLKPQFSEVLRFKEILTLQDKWILASRIFHSEKNNQTFKKWFEVTYTNKDIRILDSSAGTGIDLRLIKELGYSNLFASEYSENEVKILKDNTCEFLSSDNIFTADWNELSKGLGQEKFDLILCIGTSIPYYKSWDEINGSTVSFKEAELKKIIGNFSKHLSENGQIIFGLSRENYSERGYKKIFPVKEIDNVKHKMDWTFEFDWDNRIRKWDCDIIRDDELNYSFKAESHLFNPDELRDWCQEIYPNYNVEIIDIDPNKEYYDLFIIISK